jgi:tetratricopeptide (TPR) repeat protein
MDKPPQPEKQVDQMTKEGLILVPYFYEALGDFANQPAAMSTYYRQMILGIALPKERQRLAGVKFSPPAEARVGVSHPVVHRGAADALLEQGDNLIFEGKYLEAKAVFSNVLSSDARNERALFGMAVVASNTRKPDIAEDYFKKTLEVARSLRVAAWSHIYLGRIYDLEGNRKQALAQYHAASLAAGAFPDALRAVQSGLAQPFGARP